MATPMLPSETLRMLFAKNHIKCKPAKKRIIMKKAKERINWRI